MLYLAIGCALLAALVWAGRARPVLKRREWRLVSAAFSIAAFAAAAYEGVRGGWAPGTVLAVIGLWLASSARAASGSSPRTPIHEIGDREARSILGVGPQASEAEIQAAYSRLMRMAHPDRGGTDGLASQLNSARDRLLRKPT